MNDTPSVATPTLPYRIGCPVWNCEHWSDDVYPAGTARNQYLRWYTRCFNTVEGNGTFYGLPTPAAASRWVEQAAVGFHFCFKVPRVITHDLRLVSAEEETRAFLGFLEPFASADLLGPVILQLGPDFSPEFSSALKSFLEAWPVDIPLSVEVRHLDWYDESDNEARLDEWLCVHGFDKVLFDSTALFQSPPSDEHEQKSQNRKPRTPVRRTVTGSRPVMRLIGRNDPSLVESHWEAWAETIDRFVDRGLTPYVFTHAPADAMAPTLARQMADRIALSIVGDQNYRLPPRPFVVNEQLSLFDS
ncbi:MAG: DUF72 domain-containing protein [Planctomycetota bacterium]